MDVKSFIVQGPVLKQKLIQTSFSSGDYIPINSFRNTLFCTNSFLLKKTWTQKNQKILLTRSLVVKIIRI
jgi:hypothetical protein